MTTIKEIVEMAIDKVPVVTVGTVVAVDKGEFTCEVRPEDGGQNIEDVPLRIMRPTDDWGVIVVPKVGTEVIVLWLDEYRKVLLRAQEWDEVIIKTRQNEGMELRSGEVLLGNLNRVDYRAVRGEELDKHLAEIKVAIVALGGAIGDAPDTIYSPEVKIS